MLNDPGQREEVRQRLLNTGAASIPVGREADSLDSKIFKRLDQFKGTVGSWREWSFHFLTTLGGNNEAVAEALNEVLKASAAPLTKDLLDKAVPADLKLKHAGNYFWSCVN